MMYASGGSSKHALSLFSSVCVIIKAASRQLDLFLFFDKEWYFDMLWDVNVQMNYTCIIGVMSPWKHIIVPEF